MHPGLQVLLQSRQRLPHPFPGSAVELISPILGRVTESFPSRVRTLDALQLATMIFLQENGQRVSLASYDENMTKAARALRLSLYEL
jgi:hypothetical protein